MLVHNLTESSRYVAKDPPVKILEFIIEYGAEMDTVDKKLCQSALHVACISENFKFVKLLVEKGADFGIVDNNLKMPINYVEAQENRQQKKIFKWLRSNGAKLSWKY